MGATVADSGKEKTYVTADGQSVTIKNGLEERLAKRIQEVMDEVANEMVELGSVEDALEASQLSEPEAMAIRKAVTERMREYLDMVNSAKQTALAA
jgi:hypothetical protein